MSFKATNGWLGITDKYWAAALLPDTKAPIQAQFSYDRSARRSPTRPTISVEAQTVAPGATARQRTRLFAGAKEVAIVASTPTTIGGSTKSSPQPLRSADRLGLVLLHHQADVHGDRLALPFPRQFRPRHPARHRHRQVHLLPARQQILRVDGEDEEGAAGDDGDPRTLRRRQGEAAAGDDGALQEREDQSARRLPADR